ncbi:Cyclin-D-binding Myb-like transcription factor 1 [Mortierella sp. AD011]|nr:Cyclin-D-binding Myb-like transcription factor 1 [Mortierella sp. AD010]KAF9399381.1 Cyclin-D-binding Myb-like transcription factor 1 [Mortierella sp. AD011]
MALVELRRLLQPAIGRSFMRLGCSPLRSTCNRAVLPATTFVHKRFYFPSFFTPTEDKTSSEDKEPLPWTKDEEEQLEGFLKAGKSIVEFVNHFPDRTINSIETRMSDIRKRRKRSNVEELPSEHKPSTAKSWTIQEDERLIEAVNRLGYNWGAIAEEVIDGKRMGRSSTACERRYRIICLDENLKFGIWEYDEGERLNQAIWKQVAERINCDPNEEIPRGLYSEDNLTKINWKKVSESVGTRTDYQCRSHVFKSLLNKKTGFWTEDETERLVDGIKEFGLKWKMLAEVVETRSAFQVKQKYYLSKGLKRELMADRL